MCILIMIAQIMYLNVYMQEDYHKILNGKVHYHMEVEFPTARTAKNGPLQTS